MPEQVAIERLSPGTLAGEQSSDARMAEVMSAMAAEHRLQIVELLRAGERCVCEITPAFRLDPSVVSRHLAVLEHAGVVRSRRDGRRVYFQIADRRALRLADIARQMAVRPDRAQPAGPEARRKAARC